VYIAAFSLFLKAKDREKYMKVILNIVRIIVGVLFIFSGLVKANDPLGLSYKMQEFFEVWGWNFFNDYTLSFSVLMIAFEIIAGVAVLLGWRMKLFSWLLLLLIIFFTFLTGYAVLSGKIHACGCFGDCIPLTANQSFTKDLILTALILFIFRYKDQIRPFFKPGVSLIILVTATLFSFGAQSWVLRHLPPVDCLPYKIGKNLPAQMKVPAGAIPDSTVITLVYTKHGKEVEFTSDKFPDDYDEPLYQFVRRYDKLIRKGNAEAPVKDFALKTDAGNDTTQAILNADGYTMLVFVRDEPAKDSRLAAEYAWLNEHFRRGKKGALYIVTPHKEAVYNAVATKEYDIAKDILVCDYVAVKTAGRNDVTIYLLNKGTVIKKWADTDFDKVRDFVSNSYLLNHR
jgi:uncharacterized membrane protein YphA (DoxX/SURF4 family)